MLQGNIVGLGDIFHVCEERGSELTCVFAWQKPMTQNSTYTHAVHSIMHSFVFCQFYEDNTLEEFHYVALSCVWQSTMGANGLFAECSRQGMGN